jgi:hypothetical protein
MPRFSIFSSRIAPLVAVSPKARLKALGTAMLIAATNIMVLYAPGSPPD